MKSKESGPRVENVRDANHANQTPEIEGLNAGKLIAGLIGSRGINQPGSMLNSGRQRFKQLAPARQGSFVLISKI